MARFQRRGGCDAVHDYVGKRSAHGFSASGFLPKTTPEWEGRECGKRVVDPSDDSRGVLWEIREQIVCYAFEISRGFGGPANLRLSAMLFIGDQLFDLLPDLFVIYPFAVLNLS